MSGGKGPLSATGQTLATTWPDGIVPTPEFAAAAAFIAGDAGNLFVTGRAGTGKSTLLRASRTTPAKRWWC